MYRTGQNLIQWLAPRAGVRGESHPQQIDCKRRRTEGRFHNSLPEPPRPQRWK